MTTPSSLPSGHLPRPVTAARVLGVLGALSVLAYALFAAIQIQVLNPLAAVPGSTLTEIHAAVGRSADTMGWPLMVAALLPGPVIAAVAAVASWRGRISTSTLLMIMLGLLAGGTPVYFVASFPAGMTLADTFGIGGADSSPWATLLHYISMLALLVLAVVTVRLLTVRATQARVTPSA